MAENKQNQQPHVDVYLVDSIELEAWITTSKPYWLTVADVKELKQGDRLEIVHLDRNVYDVVTDPENNQPGTTYLPSKFFACVRAEYTHDNASVGTMVWRWSNNKQKFEWEVEYKDENWYPLNKGILPAHDPQLEELFGQHKPLLGREVAWADLPANMHVGWRGPMLRCTDLDKLSPVYYD
jgi:hypothetical protein